MRLEFQVRGSAGDLYEITAERMGGEVAMFCTCQAGRNGMHCKHRFMLLDGVVDNLASENHDDVLTLKSWVPGSRMETAMVELAEAEAAMKAAQAALTRAKKVIAQVMRGDF